MLSVRKTEYCQNDRIYRRRQARGQKIAMFSGFGSVIHKG